MSANSSVKGKYTIKMMWYKLRSPIKKYGIFYVIGLVIAFALKLYYSRADIDALDWILAPTTRWVQLLCGIMFEKEPGIGYVNHNYKFVIAPVCAGINFIVIAITTLVLSFTHRMSSMKGRVIWLLSSLVFIYPYTILVNSLRIIPSIYLLQMDIYGGWITPERVHTMEGTLVYFVALLFLYSAADRVAKCLALRLSRYPAVEVQPALKERSSKDKASAVEVQSPRTAYFTVIKWFLPVFFYFSITLGIPFLNGAYTNNRDKFLEFGVLVSVVCFFVLGVLCLWTVLKRHLKSQFASFRESGGD